jgi:hypothetical protein
MEGKLISKCIDLTEQVEDYHRVTALLLGEIEGKIPFRAKFVLPYLIRISWLKIASLRGFRKRET